MIDTSTPIKSVTYNGTAIPLSVAQDNTLAAELAMRTISEYNDVEGKVEKVGDFAFHGCNKLINVSFPNCLYVGASAFFVCTSLKSVYMPKCSAVGTNGFYYTSLENINFPNCIQINMGAFSSCRNMKSINIPHCTFISDAAFYYNYSLQSASLPCVSNLGQSVFYACSSLISAYTPLVGLKSNTFMWCSNLKTATLSAYIGNQAFRNCYSLESVYITNTRPSLLATNAFTSTPIMDSSYLGYYGSIYVPSQAVSNFKTSTDWVALSDRITAIPSEIENDYIFGYEFQSGSSLPSEKFNAQIIMERALDQNTFSGDLTFPNCKAIGNYAFYSCVNLSKISAPNCGYIDNNAFALCSNLTDVYFQNCRRLGYQAFYSCKKLINVNLENCLQIDTNAFRECTFLTSVSLPNCLRVGDSAFQGCYRLSSIYLPLCQSIGQSAFSGCGLQSIDLPKCLTIRMYAFRGCSKLSIVNLTSNSNVVSLENYAFSDANIVSFYVPSSLYSDYIVAPRWSAMTSRITSASVPV